MICQYCKKPSQLTREHVIPVSKGGCNHLHNILLVCEKCNKARGNMPMYQWIQLCEKNITDIVARKCIRAVDCMVKGFVKHRTDNIYLRSRLDGVKELL